MMLMTASRPNSRPGLRPTSQVTLATGVYPIRSVSGVGYAFESGHLCGPLIQALDFPSAETVSELSCVP